MRVTSLSAGERGLIRGVGFYCLMTYPLTFPCTLLVFTLPEARDEIGIAV